MHRVIGTSVLAVVLSLSVSGCGTMTGAAVGAGTGAAAGAVFNRPGKGAAVGAAVGAGAGLLYDLSKRVGTGYVKVESDIPFLNFAYPSDDPLMGIVKVGRYDWKKAVVAVAVDGKTVYRASPPYSVKVAVNGFGRHEISAEVFVWSSSAGRYLPAQRFKTDFEARPNASCDDWGNCWKAEVTPSGISAY